MPSTNLGSFYGFSYIDIARLLLRGEMSIYVTGRNTGWYLRNIGPGFVLTIHLGSWIGWRPIRED